MTSLLVSKDQSIHKSRPTSSTSLSKSVRDTDIFINMYACCFNFYHPGGRALISDWSENSFIMVVCENIFIRVFNRKF